MILPGRYSVVILKTKMIEDVLIGDMPREKAEGAVSAIIADILNGKDVLLHIGCLTKIDDETIEILPIELVTEKYKPTYTLGTEVEIRSLVDQGFSRRGAEKLLQDALAQEPYKTRFD